MRLATNAGVSLGLGAAAFAVIYGLDTYARPSAAEHNPQVQACAAQLGPVAIQEATLPKGCARFEHRFPYLQVIVNTYEPETQQVEAHEQLKIYVLPPAADFKEQEIITPEEEQAHQRDAWKVGLMGGGLGALLMFGTLYAEERKKRKAEQPSDQAKA